MSVRYSPEVLKGMAEIVVEDYASGGHSSLMLVIAMATATGLNANDVMAKIGELTR